MADGHPQPFIRSTASISVLALAPSILSSLAKPPDPTNTEFPVATVDSYVQRWMARRHIPGVVIGVARGDKVQYLRGFGKADSEQQTPVTSDTPFEIASLTKQFTSFAILCLVQDGKLKLDDPICIHLDDVPAEYQKITVRHLLNHTSGLHDYVALPEFNTLLNGAPSKGEIKKLILSKPLKSPPGERWEYCNSGYYLAGLIIEKCSKKDYFAYLKEKIFDPLKMRHTRASGPIRSPQLAQGLEWKGDRYQPSPVINNTILFSAGGLVSTAGDMLKWQQALDTDRLLPANSRYELWQQARLNNGQHPDNVKLFVDSEKVGYGLGWFVKPDSRGCKWQSHYGMGWGYTSYIVKIPHEGLTVVVLTNKEGIEEAAPFFTPFLLGEGITRIYASDAIRPSNPQQTKKTPNSASLTAFKESLEALAKNSVNIENFSPDFWKMFSPQAPDYSQFLTAVGQYKSITLLDESEKNGARNSQYKVQFKDTAWVFELTLASDGKISKFGALHEID